MKHVLRVAACILMVLILVACGAPAAESGEDSPQPEGGAVQEDSLVVTQDNAGETIKLNLGDQVVVKLDSEHEWKLTTTPALVIAEMKDAALPEGANGILEAKMAGRATLQAIGKPNCLKEDPPCSDAEEQFTVTFEVVRE